MTGKIRQNLVTFHMSLVTFKAAEPSKRWRHRRVRSDLFGRVMAKQVFFFTMAWFTCRTCGSFEGHISLSENGIVEY